MKTRLGIFLFSLLLAFNSFSDDQLPDPITEAGQNLDLETVGELFASSKSLEDFEIALNTESNDVNNLDLNGDGNVNYIKIEEKIEDSTHVIFLRVPLENNDAQDVATIEIEKQKDGSVNIQIVGDEEIYGENYILEHIISKEEVQKIKKEAARIKEEEKIEKTTTEEETKTTETKATETTTSTTTVTYVYLGYSYYPHYSPYHSPYYWGYYPVYYRPYRPVTISIYRSRTSRYRRNRYKRTTRHRSKRCKSIKSHHRRSSKNSSYNYKKQSQKGKTNSNKSTQQKKNSSNKNQGNSKGKSTSPSKSSNKSKGGGRRR